MISIWKCCRELEDLSRITVNMLIKRVVNGDFDLDDKKQPVTTKKFEDKELEDLIEEYSCRVLQEL